VAQQQPRAGGLLEPVRQSVRVRRPIEAAFELFTRDIGTWWPVETHHVRGDVEAVVFEGGLGGRIYERSRSGETTEWGRVLAWEPPSRVVFTWERTRGSGAATEVEVRFFAEEPTITRVDLEHRGWERLADHVEQRERYLNGWPFVVGRFADGAGRDQAPA
jgi:uncharacterized protein YndB with AHSA1/START domain